MPPIRRPRQSAAERRARAALPGGQIPPAVADWLRELRTSVIQTAFAPAPVPAGPVTRSAARRAALIPAERDRDVTRVNNAIQALIRLAAAYTEPEDPLYADLEEVSNADTEDYTVDLPPFEDAEARPSRPMPESMPDRVAFVERFLGALPTDPRAHYTEVTITRLRTLMVTRIMARVALAIMPAEMNIFMRDMFPENHESPTPEGYIADDYAIALASEFYHFIPVPFRTMLLANIRQSINDGEDDEGELTRQAISMFRQYSVEYVETAGGPSGVIVPPIEADEDEADEDEEEEEREIAARLNRLVDRMVDAVGGENLNLLPEELVVHMQFEFLGVISGLEDLPDEPTLVELITAVVPVLMAPSNVPPTDPHLDAVMFELIRALCAYMGLTHLIPPSQDE